MAVRSVFHVGFVVRDLDVSIRFYADGLGLRLRHRQTQDNDYTRSLVGYAECEPDVATVLDQMARAYATRFTEQELKDLLVFYKTPLGQKFTREEPNAIEDGLKRAQQWADTFAETVMARMRSEMQKKGHPL